jgi:hypothetical protein
VHVDVGAGAVDGHDQERDRPVLEAEPSGQVGEVALVQHLRPVAVADLDVVEQHLVAGRDDGAAYLAGGVRVLVQPLADVVDEPVGEAQTLELVPDRGPSGLELLVGVLVAAAHLGMHRQVGAVVLVDRAEAGQVHGILAGVRRRRLLVRYPKASAP